MAEKTALAAVAASTATASYGWLATANDLGTLIVTLIAIVGGVAATLYHWERYKKLRKDNKEKK